MLPIGVDSGDGELLPRRRDPAQIPLWAPRQDHQATSGDFPLKPMRAELAGPRKIVDDYLDESLDWVPDKRESYFFASNTALTVGLSAPKWSGSLRLCNSR